MFVSLADVTLLVHFYPVIALFRLFSADFSLFSFDLSQNDCSILFQIFYCVLSVPKFSYFFFAEVSLLFPLWISPAFSVSRFLPISLDFSLDCTSSDDLPNPTIVYVAFVEVCDSFSSLLSSYCHVSLISNQFQQISLFDYLTNY